MTRFGESSYRSKRKVAVTLRLKGDRPREGYLFCAVDERVSDVLNDSREFLPFEQMDGEVLIVAKNCLATVVPRPDESALRRRRDPYEVIGAPRDADMNTLRRAYRDRVRAVHPDRFAAANLPPELLAAANQMLAQINAAFESIVEERGLDQRDRREAF